MTQRLHEVGVEFEVPFHDVDALRIVWHGHYYKYLELGRTALMRSRGLDVPEIADAGFLQMVIDTRCRHTFPLRYGERARVSAWFVDLSPRIVIDYRIRNLTQGRCSARARTTLITTDVHGRLLLETPDVLLDRLQA
ncbi:MAG: acyl-CoA thioesterase [Myxococcales bacterium]|nr:acyl-CoA thioesterase [Myxococcales bacterium]